LYLAAASVLLSVYSWMPVSWYIYWIIFPMHLAIMAVMGTIFVLQGRRNLVSLFRRIRVVERAPLPPAYWYCFALALAYCLAVFIGVAVTFPSRTYLGPQVDLRVFSAGYLFLSVASLGFSHAMGKSAKAEQMRPNKSLERTRGG
jgi:hypothetical protein